MIEARVPVRVTLDDDADAAYIYLADEIADGGIAWSVTAVDFPDGMINLDFDSDGRLLGIEILSAADTLPGEFRQRVRDR
jgi:uncharacterized protein YuzE